MLRYRILVEGRLSSRFATSLEGVELEPCGERTALFTKLDDAADLDSLLGRLGDLGLQVVSLAQERDPA